MVTPSYHAKLVRDFPRLANEDYKEICPQSKQYNCIAYVAGDTSQPWSDEAGYYWPPEVGRDPTLQGLANLFRRLGFKRCSSIRLEAKYQKIALYAKSGLWTHASRQMPNGRWRSKLGDGVLLEHRTPDSLNGDLYGRPQLYMRRERPQ